ncbi:MAG: hypothetical protein ACRES4_07850, partial [Nevskiales bacterium]
LTRALTPRAQNRLTPPAAGVAAPAFTHTAAAEWINSPPLTLESLRGQVVLLDFWTFACWNCYRSFPWLNAIEARLHQHGLARLLLSTWIGEAPTTQKLKAALLGRPAS